MFTKCGLCEYLKVQIDKVPRGHDDIREGYILRLGEHHHFQEAQRLAQARVEEACAQSAGRKWFMKTDKADQKKTVLPTVWSQLHTHFLKEGARVVCGIIGSMWHGTMNITHHVRTIFEDCEHGSEMQ